MTPERLLQIQHVYDEACDCGESQRAPFLHEVCRDDEELRSEVEALFAEEKRIGTFMEEPAFRAVAAELADARRESWLGRTIGHYEILSFVGAGGMGEVYMARDTRLQRHVAIKVLAESLLSSPQAKERFEREAQTAAGLNHPNICVLHDVGWDNGIDFIVMEYLEGETLRERLQKGAMPLEEALQIAIPIADALDKTHSHGVVHKDLKPGNIMLTGFGPKLLDFGLARPSYAASAPDRPSTEMEPAISGTPAYLAPECLDGARAGAAADIWAFGCLLYEMLTGTCAFGRATLPQTIVHILKHEPDWQLLPANTPLSVHELLRACLAKNRNERPTRMMNVRNALTQSQGSAMRHNLPPQSKAFVGREKELIEIASLLATHRLVTLTGTGGVGKTRLALQIAQNLLGDFPDGVWLVELAAIADPQSATQVLATALGVHERPGKPAAVALFEYLETRRALIVLDNCEHIVEAASALAEEILRRTHGAKVMATSRRSLNLPDERVWRVPALSMPSNLSAGEPIYELTGYDAIRLFLDRARSVLSEFELTRNNAQAIVEICKRLDGIPLAIELAAARLRFLSPRQVNEKLSNRFALLRDPRTVQPRHRSLQATLDWSYGLLPAEEQDVFRQLAVFVGGWTLEAAETVCITPDGSLVFEVLSALTDNCLVQTRPMRDGIRFEFTESIRQYALEKLKAAGEQASVSDRHLAFFAEVASKADARLQGPAQQILLEELAAENDNFRAALTRGFQANPAVALGLANSLFEYWRIRGHLVEAEGWLTQALAQEVPRQNQPAKATALSRRGWIAVAQGKPGLARQFSEEALDIFRENNDEFGIGRCLGVLGTVALHTGEYELARSFYEENLRIFRKLGNSRNVAGALSNLGIVARRLNDLHKARDCWELAVQIARGVQDQWSVATTLNNLGLLYHDEHDLATAEKLWLESLALRRSLSDKGGIATSLYNLGTSAFEKGDFEASRKLLLQALAYYDDLRDRTSIAGTLLHLARASAAQDQYRRAAVLTGAAVSQRQIGLGTWGPFDASVYDHLSSVLEKELGKEAFAEADAAGRALTLEHALTLARAAVV
jgi:predicted ATPase